jgi:predicted nucleic acid-binding protein
VIFFVDASALVKLYHEEVGAEAMRQLFRRPEHQDTFFVTNLVALEVLVRLAKRGRAGGRRERRRFDRVLKEYTRHREEYLHVVGVEPSVVRNAESIAVVHSDSGAGTLDLVHAASARQVQDRLPDQPLTFVVADRKLRSLVERLGFRTFDPEHGDPSQLAPDVGGGR